MKSATLFLTIVSLYGFEITSGIHPTDVTIINQLRDFRPLYLGDQKDYFISNKVASVQDAESVCQSIGKNFHLVTLEDEEEYRTLLPYLRSLETERIWTGGEKKAPSRYQWTQPSPGVSMNFSNFPSPNELATIPKRKQITLKNNNNHPGLPRCKNGILTPKCNPGKCNVTLEPCTTETKPCVISSEKPCTTTRPDCGASCNNCTVENPVCQVIQKPCEVITKPCQTTRPPCTITTPECVTVRPPCITVYPPCEVTTPQPCTTTTRGPCTTESVCTTTQVPCVGGKCFPAVTKCKPVLKCQPDPEVCLPGAIICPAPIISCPPEETVCKPPTIYCPKPLLDCPEPEVDCPIPKTFCTPPKVTCDSPEVNCPGIVVNCPAPSFSCPSPEVICPPAKVECDDFEECVYPTVPIPCTDMDFNDDEDIDDIPAIEELVTSVPKECDDCLPTGCVALKKNTDFKFKLEDCSKQFQFICEGAV